MNRGCEFYMDALTDRAAGRLDGASGQRLDAHVAGCEECRRSLAVMRAVRRAVPAVPEGLEARVRSAVHSGPGTPAPDPSVDRSRESRLGRRPWAVPLAAAATLAVVWLGVVQTTSPDAWSGAVVAPVTEYEPYGEWPAAGGWVAGDPLLGDLSVEELERLLEEMES